jgi:hypothetical protein
MRSLPTAIMGGVMLELPADYDSFKRSVLDDQQDDDQGVYEVLWAANTRYPDLALSSRLAIAESVVSEFLSEGLVRLVRGEWTGPDSERDLVEDPSAALFDWATWTLPSGEPVVWMTRH